MRVLVTGANRGIGLGICATLASRGDEVIAVCRSPSPELLELRVTVVSGVDLREPSALAALREAIGGAALDLVVVNAASNDSFDIDTVDDLDPELFDGDLRVNVVG